MSSEAKVLNPAKPEDPQYVFWGLIFVTSCIICVAIAAFLFNKGIFPSFPGSRPVDEGQWIAVVFTLQFLDFASDINLMSGIK